MASQTFQIGEWVGRALGTVAGVYTGLPLGEEGAQLGGQVQAAVTGEPLPASAGEVEVVAEDARVLLRGGLVVGFWVQYRGRRYRRLIASA